MALNLSLKDDRDKTRRTMQLTDPKGGVLAEKKVKLEPGDETSLPFCELPVVLAGGEGHDNLNAALEALGRSMSDALLGPIENVLLSSDASTLVFLNPGSELRLLDCPLQLAQLEGRSLHDRGIEVVYVTEDKKRAGKVKAISGALRILAVFAAPDTASPDNRRSEPAIFQALCERVAEARGVSIDLRVVQYGANRDTLRDALDDEEGWDMVHLGFRGEAKTLMLETRSGGMDRIPLERVAHFLNQTASRIKLLTMTSVLPPSSLLEADRVALGFGVPGKNETEEGVEGSAPAAKAQGVQLVSTQLPALAYEWSRTLKCVAVATRYALDASLAQTWMATFLEQLIDARQPVLEAFKQARRESLSGFHSKGTPSGHQSSETQSGADGPALQALLSPIVVGAQASELKLVAPWRVPSRLPQLDPLAGFPPRPAVFAGRLKNMMRASLALADDSPSRGILFYGTVGAGKTTCALELIHRHERERFEDMVWFQVPEDVDSGVVLLQWLHEFESRLHILGHPMTSVADDPTAFEEHVLQRLTSVLQRRSVLVVLDGVEALLDEGLDWKDTRWRRVMDVMLTHKGSSRVVMTSRRLPAPLKKHPAVRLEPVHALTLDETLLLVRERPNLAAMQATPEGRMKLARLVEALQGHGLMLEMADCLAEAQDRLEQILVASESVEVRESGSSRAAKTAGRVSGKRSEKTSGKTSEKTSGRGRARKSGSSSAAKTSGKASGKGKGRKSGSKSGSSPAPKTPGGGVVSPFPASTEEELARLKKFTQEGYTDFGGKEFVQALEVWISSCLTLLEPEALTLLRFLCCLEPLDRREDVVRVTWADFLTQLERGDRGIGDALASQKGLEKALAPLQAMGFVKTWTIDAEPPETEASTCYDIHSHVATLMRSGCETAWRVKLDSVMGAYWAGQSERAAKSTRPGSVLVVARGIRHAIPYLVRAGAWENAEALSSAILAGEPTSAAVALALLLSHFLVEASRGTEKEPPRARNLAQALILGHRFAEAETLLRGLIDSSLAKERYLEASESAGLLLDLLLSTQRSSDALEIIAKRAEWHERAGLDPATREGDERKRLEILGDQGQYREVLDAMHGLVSGGEGGGAGTDDSAAVDPEAREKMLMTGRKAALNSGQWAAALRLSDEIVSSQKKRGAGQLEITRSRMNDYWPILKLHRDGYDEARALLQECRTTFEQAQKIDDLGRAYAAQADLEDAVGHSAAASWLAQSALRYAYQASDAEACALIHANLAGYLERRGAPADQALIHRLAGVLMAYQWKSPLFERMCQDLAGSELPEKVPSYPKLADAIEKVKGVQFRLLFENLPARAANGQAAMNAVWSGLDARMKQTEKASADREEIVAALPTSVQAAFAFEGADFTTALQAGLSQLPEEEALKIVRRLESADIIRSESASNFVEAIRMLDPLLRGIAEVALGNRTHQARIVMDLGQLHAKGWQIGGAVQSIWGGERDEEKLVEGLDANSARLVRAILALIAQEEQAGSDKQEGEREAGKEEEQNPSEKT